MILVKFKNLKKSELVSYSVIDRVSVLVEKFPDLREGKIRITLEMENSPAQAGPDYFKVKVYISRGRYGGVIVEKSSSNLYVALADVIDHLLEKLNRFGDKNRVRERNNARQIAKKAEEQLKIG